MIYDVFDIEADELLDKVTVIHCLCYTTYDNGIPITSGALTNYNSIIEYLNQPSKILVGHNIIRYDKPVLEKILGRKFAHRWIDTLGLSWYLTPQFEEHGLEVWGERYGVPKPQVTDWKNQPIEVYVHRCSEDVKINSLLFHDQIRYLKELYNNDSFLIDRLINYLTFKLECAAEQEQLRWKLDVSKCQENLAGLMIQREERFVELQSVMPKITKKKVVEKPSTSRYFKADGELSVAAEKWIAYCANEGVDPNSVETLTVPGKVEEPNPGSFPQIKAWLFSLGWVPATYKLSKRKKKGQVEYTVKNVPQLSTPEGEICDSVKALYEIAPQLERLENLFIINHRITILKGFLKDVDEEGYLKANIDGFTNTLRFQHKFPIVNLPTVEKKLGQLVRECLVAPEGYELCGSDMSSLEDNTKQHYMYYFDPEYVKEMRTPGFDPHLDIALQARMLSLEQVNAHKAGIEKHTKVRKDAKVVNFSAVYGVGAPKLVATNPGWTITKAKELLSIYWKRNWAVKEVARHVATKTIGNQMWLFNPVSQFWYSLRAEKDKFSTLNQGTGVFCFDTWVSFVRAKGYKLCGQFHDEIITPILIGMREQTEADLRRSIQETNDKLRLNIELGISVDFGPNYAAIH